MPSGNKKTHASQPSAIPTAQSMANLKNTMHELVCETLRGHLSAMGGRAILPGSSFRSQEESDPLHAGLVDGIVSGLQWFLLHDTSGWELCRNLSAKEILRQFGLTDRWCTDEIDLFHKRLYERACNAVEKVINRHRPLASKSEIEHALRVVLKEYGRYFHTNTPLSIGDLAGLVASKLGNKRADRSHLLSVCRKVGFSVNDDKVFVSQEILPPIPSNPVPIEIKSDGPVQIGGNSPVKIKKIDLKAIQASFADSIGAMQYKPQFGISSKEFDAVREQLATLPPESQTQLANHFSALQKAQTETEKQGALEAVVSFFKTHGIPVAHSLTAAYIFELAKCLSFN